MAGWGGGAEWEVVTGVEANVSYQRRKLAMSASISRPEQAINYNVGGGPEIVRAGGLLICLSMFWPGLVSATSVSLFFCEAKPALCGMQRN